MKKKFWFPGALLIFCCLFSSHKIGHCGQNVKKIDPCSLIAVEEVFKVFPELQKAEKGNMGPNAMCSFFNKNGIPAFSILVSKAPKNVRNSLSLLGPGYQLVDVAGIGDEAAMAIQKADPKYNLKEGVAALHVKKGNLLLGVSPFNLDVKPDSDKMEALKKLVQVMLEKL